MTVQEAGRARWAELLCLMDSAQEVRSFSNTQKNVRPSHSAVQVGWKGSSRMAICSGEQPICPDVLVWKMDSLMAAQLDRKSIATRTDARFLISSMYCGRLLLPASM